MRLRNLVQDKEQVLEVDLGELRCASHDADLGLRGLVGGELDPRRAAPRCEGVRPRGKDEVGVQAPEFPADVLRLDRRYLVRWPHGVHGQGDCFPVGAGLYSYQDLREGLSASPGRLPSATKQTKNRPTSS